MNDAPRFTICLTALLASDSALKRIPLAMVGAWVKGKQKFAITRATLRSLVENFRKRAADAVIDYEHASEYPDVAQGQPIPAAGWLKAVEDEPDAQGILWGLAEWTARATEMIGKKELRYISPAIDYGALDKRTGEPQGATLTSAAITNRPFLDQLPALTLSDGWNQQQRSTTVKKSNLKLSEAKDGLHVTCGECGADSIADFPEGFGPSVADPHPKEGVIQSSDVLQLTDARTKDGRIDPAKLTGRKFIAGEVFAAYQREAAAIAEVEAAVTSGKITPANRASFERLALSDIENFREIVKGLKPAVDLTEKGHGGGDGEKDIVRASEQIRTLTEEKQKAEPTLTFGAAQRMVLSEHPELAKTVRSDLRSRDGQVTQ